ncbi:serine hydrolase domain-containing protein [Thermobifida fusca]|uniref:serine hydrolase domain-containing protein n=1 Tax=Thermobifida TaxID=83677 RepID=UPI00077CAAA1|nr:MULTISPECIES: serine hydrolase domain-containing protein [Thermobifida]MBO2529872.1 esterase [Thermobifida sp.]PPS94017.1 esterase [Thermobifida fusca]PZN61622.1 MAG: esterase [Thermobifida fusca]QOS59818.1 beta-lactamase family protein [Thermobifida fusca]
MRDGEWVADTGTELRGILKVMVDVGWLPGGVAVVGSGEVWENVAVGRVGVECGEAVAAPDTRYDVAELTKVMATWPLVGQAIADGLLDLDAPMAHYFPGSYPGSKVTIRQILTYTCRLSPVTWLERYVGTDQPLAEAILVEELEKPGYCVTDRGFILLGLLLERVRRQSLDQLATDLWRHMGLSATRYGPLPRSPSVAPTERRIPGAPATWGVVHDENAALMGGVAGHAGVFTTIIDLGIFARELLAWHAGEHGTAQLTGFVRQSWLPHQPVDDRFARGLAWKVTDDGLVYHNGSTGTSLFLHPSTGRYIGLLTNAIHYGRRCPGLSDLRATIRAVFTY